MRHNIDEMLAAARARLRRLTPAEAAVHAPLGVLSAGRAIHRASPRSALHELGFVNTTDVIGGFAAWVAAGLPVDRG